jgi:tetratricopeptide (TPR) repeat protein
MKTSNRTYFRDIFSETQRLKRVILYTGIALILSALSFGSYYYVDRYIHLGDQSPVEKSIQELEALIRQHPDDVELRMALAESYMADSRFEDANQQAAQVLSAYPDNERAMFVSGVSLATLEKWEQAIGPLEQFVVIRSKLSSAGMDSSLETALYFLGQSYLSLGRFDESVTALTQVVKINTADSDAYYLLGVAYSKSGRHEQAVANYEEAVRFVPNYTEAFQGMAESYVALGKADHESYARGMVAFSINDYQTAKTELESAVKGLPDFAPVFIGLGLTYEELGDLQSAKENLEHALQIDPNNYTASQALGRVNAKLQN